MIDDLKCLIEAARVDSVAPFLRSLEPEARSDVRTWFEGSRRWFEMVSENPGLHGTPDDWKLRSESRGNLAWMEASIAVNVLGPKAAADRIKRVRLWAGDADQQHFVDQVNAMPSEYVRAFVEAADEVDALSAALLRRMAIKHRLNCPSGQGFHRSWLAGVPGVTMLEQLRADELMPELVYSHLASGFAGASPELLDALPVLLAEGRVDRGRLLETVLVQLTRDQRPSSERVLGRILTEVVRVEPQEIAGGLVYVLGVLATRSGSVVTALIPLATQLVVDEADLVELTGLIAGRSERAPKELLLREIRGALRSRLGDDALPASLRLLVDSDDDKAFVAKVRRLLSAVTVERAATAESAGEAGRGERVLGLWDRDPMPSGIDPPPWGVFHADPDFSLVLETHRNWMSRYLPDAIPIFLERALRDLSALDAPEQVEYFQAAVVAARELLPSRFSCTQAARIFEHLFLAGCLRASWEAAIEVADLACAATPRPSGLADLLRMLAAYAPETPERQTIPDHIAEIAAATSASKARAEARAFVLALTGKTVDELGLRPSAEAPERHPPRLAARGLWHAEKARAGTWTTPLSEIPVLGGESPVDLALLGGRFKGLSAHEHSWLLSINDSSSIVGPAKFLADLAHTVNLRGTSKVKTALDDVRRDHHYDAVGTATVLWADGGLDIPAYWHLVENARAWRTLWMPETGRYGSDPEVPPHTTYRLANHLSDAEPVLPPYMDSPAARLLLLHACETLLRLETAASDGGFPRAPVVVLSTPTWADGTLDFDDLQARLRVSKDGEIGPLDVLLALYRLRPVDPARVAELDDEARTTATDLSSRCGSTPPFDAVRVVRAWVSSGGLPNLEIDDADSEGAWKFAAQLPVPSTICEAAPDLKLDGLVSERDVAMSVPQVFPRWPDVALGGMAWHEGRNNHAHSVVRLGGRLGISAHLHLIGASGHPQARPHDWPVGALVEAGYHRRFDPELSVRAARHRWDRGQMRLVACVDIWRAVAEQGGLAGLWPAALAIAAEGCTRSPKPAGLAELLDFLVDYAVEVPLAGMASEVPPAIRELAESRGSNKSQKAARALVGAIEAVGAMS